MEDELGARKDTLRADVAEVPLGDDVEYVGVRQGLTRLRQFARGGRQSADAVGETGIVLDVGLARQVALQVGEVVVDQDGAGRRTAAPRRAPPSPPPPRSRRQR